MALEPETEAGPGVDLVRAAWTRSQVPLIFLGDDRRVVAVNDAAVQRFGLVEGEETLPDWIAAFVDESLTALAGTDDPSLEQNWARSTHGSAYRLGLVPVQDESQPGLKWLLTIERGGPTLIEMLDMAQSRFGLTDRETDVIALLSEGLSNRQIAAALVIVEPTVKFHVASILRKSGTSSRMELLARLFGIHLA
jgi:DNA-binding CsgD family transcriptional regulator